MLEIRRKKKIRKLVYSPFILFFLFVILVLLAKGSWGVYQKEKLSSFNLEKEKKELERLVLREKSLASSIDYLKTEQGMENEIRTKFRAVKENEQVAVIIDDEATATTTSATTTKKGFWYELFH